MKECKYRLPCNWCDKLDKYCDMVEPIEIKLPDPNKCEHTWIYDKSIINTGGRIDYYHCFKCGAKKVVDGDITYESGTEW